MNTYLFPFHEYWWFYLGFTALVILLLSLDLGVFHRKAHTVSFREASIWTVVWITLAVIFSTVLYQYTATKAPTDIAWRTTLEFLTGYVVELSLSVDNIFVFVIVFRYFGISGQYQHRVLFYGILGALIFRAIFIAIGAALIQYHWVVWIFGIFLIFTGLKLAFSSESEVHPEKNSIIRLFMRYVPVTPKIEGQRFWININGRNHATPLLITLLFMEMTDILFAVDSVPAIFGITREPLVVFTSNIFAILGLRSMYFLLAGAVERFYLLKYGLAIVLVFVGLKMVWLNDLFGGKFPIHVSLGIILGVIAGSILLSLYFTRAETTEPDKVAQ
jgi:tellurite resistance protein TerC